MTLPLGQLSKPPPVVPPSPPPPAGLAFSKWFSFLQMSGPGHPQAPKARGLPSHPSWALQDFHWPLAGLGRLWVGLLCSLTL